MDPEKWQSKAHILIKQNIESGISKNTNFYQGIIQRELEIINLSATKGTFVTKGEIERNFLPTLTDDPKLNHLVKTMFNQIVMQFEFSRGCI